MAKNLLLAIMTRAIFNLMVNRLLDIVGSAGKSAKGNGWKFQTVKE
jgi:hypothetical protein